MNKRTILTLCSIGLLVGAASLLAQPAYPPPPGGWTYIYNGDQLLVGAAGSGFSSLDGQWSHDNGSDEWDGSEIGGVFDVTNRPGGASLGTQSGVTYLRMQDVGDPRDFNYSTNSFGDPGSNRKVYFGRLITADAPNAATILRDGVTLTFRARIPTLAKAGEPLDPLMRDGQASLGFLTYPAAGDGYVTSDGGKGNFVIREQGNGADILPSAIAFSFTTTNDTTGGALTPVAGFAGLTFNEFNGNVANNANVNFGQGSKTNLVPFDPTEWHELYIVIRDDPADIGTHEGFIFVDGGLIPYVFKLTGGNGADVSTTESFLAMGGSATPQNWALDVDWFGYKTEAVFPPGALLPPSMFGFIPADRAVFHPAASGVSFAASALMPTNRLPASGFKMILNGTDVSSQLVLTGSDTSQSRTATYSGLQPNTIYAATYIVTDSGGLSTTNDIAFDTFVEGQLKILEAEEYNYAEGQFFDNPPAAGYAGTVGIPGVDFQDTTPNSFGVYRFDAVDTATTADLARNKYTSSGQVDYDVASVFDGEWWNYSGSFPAAPYTVWLRYASTAARQVRLDRVTSSPSLPNQTLQFVGVFVLPSSGGLNRYSYARLSDMAGNPVVVPFSGTNTYRLTALGANNDLVLNYTFFVSGATAPASSQVSVTPLPNAVGVRGNAAVEALILDGSNPVTAGSVKLFVGNSEVTAAVSKSGGVTSVKYSPPQVWSPNTTYSLALTYNDGTDRTNSWSFTSANYPVLTPAMKVNNATTPGFVWRVHQNEADQTVTVQKALDALSGALGLPNLADPASQGPASAPGTPATPGNSAMSFKIPTVINLGQDTFGDFGTFIPDEQMPGIPGTTFSYDGIAAEINAFIQLSSGFHTMVVNCDDGFRTTAGYVNNAGALMMGIREPGGSSADTVFDFAVQETGVYAFRTIYWEGGGNANIEWFMIKSDGSRVLINDTANGGPSSFQLGTIPNPPADVVVSAGLNASGQVVITWSTGTLLSADTVNGTYLPVAGATSPYTVNPASAPAKFYRVQVQ